MRIKMMSGDTLNITDEEYKKLGSIQSKGLIHISSLGGSINMSSIESILPDEVADRLEFMSAKEMKLHDGTLAIRKFGQWVDKFSGARLDSNYYPEIARDCLPEPNKKLLENFNK